MRIASALIVGIALTIAGCKSDSQRQLEREQVIIAPPLELDPTERIELARWWSNGTHLLRLDDTAAYALHEGMNRYSPPIEHGRWGKQSYALLWLEPYNTMRAEPRRVGITKIGGKLALEVPKLKPMFALQSPPAVLEDRMIGQWSGPIGTLRLQDNLRYSLQPAEDAITVAPELRLATHARGTWRIADESLLLHSDVPGIAPLRWPLTIEEKAVLIGASGGALRRITVPALHSADASPQAESN